MKPADLEYYSILCQKLRRTILEMIYKAGSGHPGGSLSIVELLVALYFLVMNIDPLDPKNPRRDRFVLSKGHAAPALYAVLSEKGYFPAHHLGNLRKFGSILQGHPDMNKVPGVEISSGSLGMGISFGVGVALAGRLNKLPYRVYVLTGCGEMDEGQNWEAFLSGAKHELNNLIVIIDYNRIQLDGSNDEIMPLGDLAQKIESFNWRVIQCDGHDLDQIFQALGEAASTKGQPSAIIAHTVKGKGVSFMEHQKSWHGRAPSKEEYELAITELQGDQNINSWSRP